MIQSCIQPVQYVFGYPKSAVCVCVCVRARVRVCVCVRARACVCVCVGAHASTLSYCAAVHYFCSSWSALWLRQTLAGTHTCTGTLSQCRPLDHKYGYSGTNADISDPLRCLLGKSKANRALSQWKTCDQNVLSLKLYRDQPGKSSWTIVNLFNIYVNIYM